MASLIDAARLLWCHGLPQIKRKPTQSIQDWLASATFAPSVVGKSLVLDGIDESELLKAICYDINRLSSAASETLRNVSEIPAMPKSLAWPYVKLYYSALFYSHSLLRLWGRSPSYLRTTDLLHLRNTINAYGMSPPFPLSTGQFLLVADGAQSRVILTPDKGGGGTHEAIWRELGKALAELKVVTTASQFLEADKVLIVRQLDRVLDLITHGGANAAWPSFMRNEIHYKQAAGVWYPYKGRGKTSELSKDIANVLDGSLDIPTLLTVTGDELALFRSGCLFLIAFARRSLADLAYIGGPKIFLAYGQTQFEAAHSERE